MLARSTPRRTARASSTTPVRRAPRTVRVGAPRRRLCTSTSEPESENVFVSNHYKGIDPKQIFAYLQRQKVAYRVLDGTNQIRVGICPCGSSNSFNFTLFSDSGKFQCYKCKSAGNWFEYQQKMAAKAEAAPATPATTPAPAPKPRPSPALPVNAPQPVRKAPVPSPAAATTATAAAASVRVPGVPQPKKSEESFSSAPAKLAAGEHEKLVKYLSNLEQLAPAQEYLYRTNRLKPETVANFKVGATILRIKGDSGALDDHVCLTYPWLEISKNNKETLFRIKMLSITDPKVQKIDPAVGRWGLFGWHLVPKGSKSIIVAQTEIDCMTIFQQTGQPVVALPSGGTALPIDVVEKLEPFDKIYLWLDDDIYGVEAAQKFANKLGLERVFIIATRSGAKEGPKNASAAHLLGKDLSELINQAKPMPHKQILMFKELRSEVRREIANPDQVAGIPSTTFPTLTKILKGFRKGELTVFTGSTGVGKTTILSQLSLDYLLQGVRTLWGSFEINNVRLAKKMIMQFAKKNLEKKEDLGDYDNIASKFASLPLHFMRFQGGTEINQVMDAMEYAVYVHDVQHVILDNLQFMMPDTVTRGFDKFDSMDLAISKLRKFATARNIHVTVIIHPRKEDDGAALSTSSVFGTAKATQEADNVLIVQKAKDGYRYLEVTKNRFSGDLGRVPYRFDQATTEYHELSPEEVEALEANAEKESDPMKPARSTKRRASYYAPAAAAAPPPSPAVPTPAVAVPSAPAAASAPAAPRKAAAKVAQASGDFSHDETVLDSVA